MSHSQIENTSSGMSCSVIRDGLFRFIFVLQSPSAMSPHRPVRGMDDSVLLSPASTDEVVMRRRNIRKFNTVAYRNDAPTRWKRASINGHIFNYDVSKLTP